MKKKITALFLSAMVATSLAACGEQQQKPASSSSTQEATSEESEPETEELVYQNMTFQIPTTWELKDNTSSQLSYYIDGKDVFMVVIYTETNTTNMDEHFLEKESEDAYFEGFNEENGMTDIKKSLYKVNDYQSYKVTYNTEASGQTFFTVNHAFPVATGLASVTFGAIDTSTIDIEDFADNFVQTIKFDVTKEVHDTPTPEPTQATTPEATPTPEQEPAAEASPSMEQSNALKSAKGYLDFGAFSHSGLIEQLEYEGFSTEAATYAADNCGADWNEQAAKSAQGYLDFSSFSRAGLIEQLEYEGFSTEQAEYGASVVGY